MDAKSVFNITYSSTELAVGTAATVFAWYAMPDVIRSRGVRAALKTVLLAGTAVATPALLKSFGIGLPEHDLPEPTPELLAMAGGVIAASIGVTVWGEKLIFGFGEKRREQGKRLAHSLPAAVIAAVSAIAVAADLNEGANVADRDV